MRRVSVVACVFAAFASACHALIGLEDGQDRIASDAGAPETDAPIADAGTEACADCDASIVSFDVGHGHSCAILDDGRLLCWGLARYAQLGIIPSDAPDVCASSLPCRFEPRKIDDLPPVKQVALGGEFACAITTGDKAYCWGSNIDGQLGHPSTNDKVCAQTGAGSALLCNPRPIEVDIPTFSGSVVQAAAGFDFACVRTSLGHVYCFGKNTYGVTGTPIGGRVYTPARIVMPNDVAAIDIEVPYKGSNVYARLADGRLVAWGDNRYGQLGHAPRTGGDISICTDVPCKPTPSVVTIDGDGGAAFSASAVSAAWFSACALSSGTVYCWGDNRYGALARTDLADVPHPMPQPIAALPPGVDAIGSGSSTVYAIADGTVWAWGANDYGELADGTRDGGSCNGMRCRTSPGAIAGLAPTTAVAGGRNYATVLGSDGVLRAWGHVAYGELAKGNIGASTLCGTPGATGLCALAPVVVEGVPPRR